MRPFWILLLVVAGSARAEAVLLDSPDKAATLCTSLQPPERLRLKGGPVSAADQKASYEEKRKAALELEYLLVLQPREFQIAEVDTSAGTISIDTTRPFRGLGGSLTIYDIEVDELTLHMDPANTKAAEAAISGGHATLAVTFKVARDEQSPCFATTARAYILATDFVSAALRNGATVLAQTSEEDGFAPQNAIKGTPSVELVPMSTDGGAPLPPEFQTRLAKVKPDVQRCYETALVKDPSLDGSVVFGWDVRSGKTVPSVQADSVQNDEVVGCLTKAISAVTVPNPKKTTVAIHLALE
jgi:hypothetical protein